jgi:cytidylate kinase
MPIIAFSGSSQTGKTELGRRLAEYCHCKFVSFGDFVRQQARNRGIGDPSRADLQNLGQQLVQSDVVDFCRAVLETVQFSSGERLVVDGVRHIEALNAISTIAGCQPIKLIYLHASMKVRESRELDRNRQETLDEIDAHPVESQTNHEIKQLADFVVDAGRDVEESFSLILKWLSHECPELLPPPTET